MIIGNKKFGFEINKKKEHNTELKMFIDNKNILEYHYRNEIRTTTWNIDSVIDYLHNDILPLTIEDNRFPFSISGNSAAELVNNAKEYDIDNEEEFDKYYDALEDWEIKHSWIRSCEGGYIADVFFRKVDNGIEISWDNRELYDDVEYSNLTGSTVIKIDEFVKIVIALFDEYNKMWN